MRNFFNSLKKHLKVFVIAVFFGLSAYAILMAFRMVVVYIEAL